MPGALLWGYDATNGVRVPLSVDANGYVKVDMSNINLNDLADVSVAAPADDDLFYYDDATSLWKSRKLVDADLSAAAQDAIAKRHIQGTDTTLGTLTADVNYATYKAIAMACDSGATVPTSPVVGQWFLHTPTGRTVLMQYDGSNWISIMSIGTMTMYVNVDGATAADSIDKGDTSANGFVTVQYAVDRIPGLVGGNVTIYIDDGEAAANSYAETVTIRGKALTGDYTITLQGNLLSQETATADSMTTGSGATQGTLTDTGAFMGDSYANLLLHVATIDEYRIIDSHTNDVITIVGTFGGAGAYVWTVYDWGTSIARINLAAAQKGIVLKQLKVTGVSNIGIQAAEHSTITLYEVASSTNIQTASGGTFGLFQCFISTALSTASVYVAWLGYIVMLSSKIVATHATGAAIWVLGSAVLVMRNGCILDGGNTGLYGVKSYDNTIASMIGGSAGGHIRIRDWDTGVYVYGGGQATTTNIVYSGNSVADETAVAASFGYIT